MQGNVSPETNKVPDFRAIRRIFKRFRGSGAWASRTLNVKPPTVSMWLRGKKTSARLNREIPKLADELLATGGKCIHTVRSKIGRIRKG